MFTLITFACLLGARSGFGLESPKADESGELRLKAEAGDGEAQFRLALQYWYNGHFGGVRKASDCKEFRECAKWAIKAATK